MARRVGAGRLRCGPDASTGKTSPPTGQHALREGRVRARNLTADIRGQSKRPFVFSTIGQLAAIGKRTGVANICGVNFSGFIAWWHWRCIYLSKLPRLEKKLHVAVNWSLDLLFSKDIVEFLTASETIVSRTMQEHIPSHEHIPLQRV
jgi:NADH dehydrogenase